MSLDLRSTAKRVLYAVRPQSLPAGVTLDVGYVIHTERVYDAGLFERLLTFCRDLQRAHGAKPICTVMSGCNPRIQGGLARHGTTADEYARRVERLGAVATLGYHGHFWSDVEAFRAREATQRSDFFHSPELDVRGTNYAFAPVAEQMEADLAWFRRVSIDHHGLYAAGWWFLHADILTLLAGHGFHHDFSFSRSPWFRNERSVKLMRDNGIRTGEPFEAVTPRGTITCVQNLIGCHTTDYPDDFTRNLRAILDPGFNAVLGAVNSHDYDLEPARTLRCLAHVADRLGGRIWGGDALLRGDVLRGRELRSIPVKGSLL